jgi:hypothetical protein
MFGTGMRRFYAQRSESATLEALGFLLQPRESATLVPKRTGIPFTLNFARPIAWVMTVPVVAGMALAAIVNNR